MELDDQVGVEDRELVESVQRGLRSGAFEHGRLMLPSEELIADFQRWVAAGLKWRLLRCPSSGASATGCTSPAARSGSAAHAGTEVPERAERIRAALSAAGARLVDGRPHPDEALLAVHDAELLDYLARRMERLGGRRARPTTPARIASSRTSSRTPGCSASYAPGVPAAITARAGLLRLRHDDADRPGHLGGGARRRRRRADRRRPRARRRAGRVRAAAGRPATTPPAPASAAPATSTTPRSRPRTCATRLGGPVAVIDIDAHHGNGTQEIFYEDPDVCSARCTSTRAGLVPALPRLRRRERRRQRRGHEPQRPLAPGTGDEAWLAAVGGLARLARERGAEALVVSLGVDAAAATRRARSRCRPTASARPAARWASWGCRP